MQAIVQMHSQLIAKLKNCIHSSPFNMHLFPSIPWNLRKHWFVQWLGDEGATSHLNQWFSIYWRIHEMLLKSIICLSRKTQYDKFRYILTKPSPYTVLIFRTYLLQQCHTLAQMWHENSNGDFRRVYIFLKHVSWVLWAVYEIPMIVFVRFENDVSYIYIYMYVNIYLSIALQILKYI